MIQGMMAALALSIATATTATAGPVADMIEGALAAKERHDMTADALALVQARVTAWAVRGLCADGSMEKIDAIMEHAPAHSCCTAAFRNGSEYADAVDLTSLLPWTPSLPETERNSVVRIIAGQVLAQPEDDLKGDLGKMTAWIRQGGFPICEAAIRDETARN